MAAKATGAVPLGRYRVGEYALVMDLLGTAERMANDAGWLEPLKDVLDIVTDVVFETTNIVDPAGSSLVFQYGDAVVFPSDDGTKLLVLGQRLLTKCALRGVLLQGAVAGGGAYHIDDPSGFGTRRPLHDGARLQVLVGPAVARGHAMLRGVRGPRLLLDEEHRAPAPSDKWERYTGKFRHSPSDEAIRTSEVRWWRELVGDEVQHHVETELGGLRAEVAQAETEMKAETKAGRTPHPLLLRRTKSLKKRTEHLEVFLQLLAE